MRDQFEQFGDVFKASAYGVDIYAINRPEHIQHVFRKNWKNYKKGFAIKRIGMLLGNGLMVSEGEFWRRQRKLIQPAFHADSIARMYDIIVRENAILLDEWASKGQRGEAINVTHDLSAMALRVVLAAIFGDDTGLAAQHFAVLTEQPARNLEFAQGFSPLRKVVAELIASRRARNVVAPDLLGMMMEARDAETGQTMPDGQLISEVMTLIVAGHETTASTLNWTWYLLSQNLAVAQRLEEAVDQLWTGAPPKLAELPGFAYAGQILEEAMRLYPAGWLMTRRAKADDQLGEYLIPAGSEIYASPYFLQRHPALWDDPDRFDPDRFTPERSHERPELAMLAFSAGPRNCIGERLARIEMQVHLTMVARRLRLRYAGATPPEMEAGVNLRTKDDVTMFAEARR